MPVIELTGSTSVVFVDTRTTSTTVLLPPLGFQSRFITIKDSYGNAYANPITVSTSSNYYFNGAGYKNAGGIVTNVSSVVINQNYASITVASAIPNTLNPSTTWILQNTFAFEDRYPTAYVQTVNSSNAIISSISTTWFQTVKSLTASAETYNAAILSAQISSANVTDWLKVGSNFAWIVPGASAMGLGAYPSSGWALDVANDARIKASLSVQQKLIVGTSNLFVAAGQAGINCNAPRYTLDIGGDAFIASTLRAGRDLLVQSSFTVLGATGRTSIGNSTGQAYLDVYGDVLVRSSMTVASSFIVGQSTFGALNSGSVYVNGWLALNAGTAGVQPLAFSTSAIGTMIQAGSNTTQGSQGNIFITGWGQANQTASFSFLSSGQLGVNCNAPQTWLDVKGGAKIDGNLTVSSGISTIGISAAQAYIDSIVGSTIAIGRSGFINVLSANSAYAGYVSAGSAYLGVLSSAQVAIETFSIGRGYVGLAANESLSSQRVSAGQAYIAGLSGALASIDVLSSGSNYFGFTSAESVSSQRISAGTSFIGILSSLSVSSRALVGFYALFSNLVGLNVQASSISSYWIYGERGSNQSLAVSSLGIGGDAGTNNYQLYVKGNSYIDTDLDINRNLGVNNTATFSNLVTCRRNVEFNGAGVANATFTNNISTIFGVGTAIGVGTDRPRTGLDVQTFANMSSLNAGVVSAGLLLLSSLTVPRIVITAQSDYSLVNEGATLLKGYLEINGTIAAANANNIANITNMAFVSAGGMYIGGLSTNTILNNNLSAGSAYIGTLSSGSNFTGLLSAGSAYIGTVSSASNFTGLLSAGYAYIGTLSSGSNFTGLLSAGSAYIGTVSSASNFTQFLSAGSAYIGTVSSASNFTGLLSAGSAYVGTLSSGSNFAGLLSAGSAYIGTVSSASNFAGLLSAGSAYIGTVSSASNFTQLLSAGIAYIDNLTAKTVSFTIPVPSIEANNFKVNILSAGTGFIGTLSSFSNFTDVLSVGTGFIGTLSSASNFAQFLSAGTAFIGTVSSLSNFTNVLSAGTAFIGTVSSLSNFTNVVSAGTAFIGTVSSLSNFTRVLSAGTAFIGTVSSLSNFTNVISAGTGFIGTVSSLSNFTRVLSAGTAFIGTVSSLSNFTRVLSVGTAFIGTLCNTSTLTRFLSAGNAYIDNLSSLLIQTSTIYASNALATVLRNNIRLNVDDDNDATRISFANYNESDTLAGTYTLWNSKKNAGGITPSTLSLYSYFGGLGTGQEVLSIKPTGKITIGMNVPNPTSLLTVAGDLDMCNNSIKSSGTIEADSINVTSTFTNELYVGNPSIVSTNLIRFAGLNGDGLGSGAGNQSPFTHTVIGEIFSKNQGSANETSELILFKGNDAGSQYGPDRVRVLATGGFAVDTSAETSWPVGGNPPNGTNRLTILSTGYVGIGTSTPTSLLTVAGDLDMCNNSIINIGALILSSETL